MFTSEDHCFTGEQKTERESLCSQINYKDIKKNQKNKKDNPMKLIKKIRFREIQELY